MRWGAGGVRAPGAKMATVINWRDAGADRDASRSQRGIAPACNVPMGLVNTDTLV